MRLTLLLSILLSAACSSGNALTSRTKDAPLSQLNEVNAKLAFTCAHEKIPAPSSETDVRWVEEREANVPPPKPSEALIEQLAKAMVLDPRTGKPLPGSPVYSKED